MKVILFGAGGTIGKKVTQVLQEAGQEVIRVGRKGVDFSVDIQNPEQVSRLYAQVGHFQAVVSAAGEVAFAPFQSLSSAQWLASLQSKLLGQVQLVQLALPYLSEGGSFTLTSGILGREQILNGVVAATINSALEGFVKAVACELPRGYRINAVSPTLLEESVPRMGEYFPGFTTVSGEKVAQAFKKSVMGIQTGQVYRVLGD